jgi:AraC-like DNA-binding protein
LKLGGSLSERGEDDMPDGLTPHPLLPTYERYRTTDPGLAESVITGFLSPHRLVLHGDSQEFAAVGRVAAADAVSLCSMTYGQEVTVDRPAQDDCYLAVLVPTTGWLGVRLKDEEFAAHPQRGVAVLSPGQRFHLAWSADCHVITLRVDIAALQQALVTLSPRARSGPLRLHSALVQDAQCYPIWGIVQTLAHVFNSFPGTAELPRLLTRQLSEQTVATLLLSVGSNYTDEIFGQPTSCAPKSIRLVLDLLDAEPRAMLTVADLAAEAGISVRALELAFRKEFDTTPRDYVMQARLKKARDDLSRAVPGATTVTDVALKWGFAHVGRFARRYREAFGVNPSKALGL